LTLDIEFSSPFKDFLLEPNPCTFYVPEEFKKMKNRVGKNIEDPTVKKCIPFLDALISGYIIPFPYDVLYWYDEEKKQANFDLPPNIPNCFSIGGHKPEQVSESLRYNKRTVDYVFKFINPWTIKTPSGYSCLFTNPFNRNSNFKIIDGIVDTDKYPNPVNFPFYWTNNYSERTLLKRGDPMCLVLPFKRQSWKITVKKTTQEDSDFRNFSFVKFFEDNYKRISWSKKSFK
jgi:hypothetical protein